MNEKETYPTQRKWIRILFLLVPLCLVVLLMAFSNALLNCWMLLIEPNYIIPKESNIFQFDVNQMNEGSGDWWIYGQDNKNYYYYIGHDSLPYITFSNGAAQICSGFDKLNVNTWCGKITEAFKSRDTTVTYAELFDDGYHALLYRSNYPELLFFVKMSDSSLYELDSIVDFYNDFAVYRTEKDYIEKEGDVFKQLSDKNRTKKMMEYGVIINPVMGSFAGELFIVGDNDVFELSLSRRSFKKIIRYHMALDIFEKCSDNMIMRLPHRQTSISSSAIRVSFQDSSFFELASNGSLNIQVVDSKSCLRVNGEYNQVRYDYAEGKKCNVGVPLCEPF
ncbi:hypothetical protein [Fibrobacter succinogenes]|uniref:hypothetical protein n=1 Tax=Fibrobacter succinogenes TaxID=833 RepID=UPI001567F5CF|nr:hypothetical protein [Fibrobacter succinogenes]